MARAHVGDFVLIASASVHRPHWTGGTEGEAWLEGSRTAGRVAIDQGLREDGIESQNEREGKDQRERGPSDPSYCAYSIGKPPSPETLLVAISSERGFQRESCPKALWQKIWKTM